MKSKAENYFHGEEGFNCAQAVLKTFQNEYELTDELILEHKKSGGGRVEGNICGALHAATLLETAEESRERFHQAFVEAAGSVTCRDIRKLGQLSCRSCSGFAAELVDNHRRRG